MPSTPPSPRADDASTPPTDALTALADTVAALADRIDTHAGQNLLRDQRLDRLETRLDNFRPMEPPRGKLDDLIPDGKRVGELGEGVAKWKGVVMTAAGLVLLYLLATGKVIDFFERVWTITHPPLRVDVDVRDPRATDNARRLDSLDRALRADSPLTDSLAP